MKELKSKKTGLTKIYTEEEYALIAANPALLKKYIVTDLKMRPIVPSIKPEEIKIVKKPKA